MSENIGEPIFMPLAEIQRRANAYPRLVEELKKSRRKFSYTSVGDQIGFEIDSLLRELGEL